MLHYVYSFDRVVWFGVIDVCWFCCQLRSVCGVKVIRELVRRGIISFRKSVVRSCASRTYVSQSYILLCKLSLHRYYSLYYVLNYLRALAEAVLHRHKP
jgi:hypothetical protein